MRECVFLRIGGPDPFRIWSGVGDIFIPADDVEDEDAIYSGAGEMLNAPDFQHVINGIAERIELNLNGISPLAFQLITESLPDIKGAPINIGTMEFDDNWQPIGAVVWEACFRVDAPSVSSQPGEGGRTFSASISAGSDDTSRSRAPIAFFTDADQRRRSPTDAIFSQVAKISQGTVRRFGPK